MYEMVTQKKKFRGWYEWDIAEHDIGKLIMKNGIGTTVEVEIFENNVKIKPKYGFLKTKEIVDLGKYLKKYIYEYRLFLSGWVVTLLIIIMLVFLAVGVWLLWSIW